MDLNQLALSLLAPIAACALFIVIIVVFMLVAALLVMWSRHREIKRMRQARRFKLCTARADTTFIQRFMHSYRQRRIVLGVVGSMRAAWNSARTQPY